MKRRTFHLAAALGFFMLLLSADAQWAARYKAAGITGAPSRLVLVAYKKSSVLQVWGRAGDRHVLVHEYPVCALRRDAGPKMREGDGMTPEGIYRVVGFNPNSAFHLSMKIDYPNRADLMRNYVKPGGDIYIHGNCVTAGCIALGDKAITELYRLCLKYRGKTDVLIFPVDDEEDWNGLMTSAQQREQWDLMDFWGALKLVWRAWTETGVIPEYDVVLNGLYVVR